MIFFKLIVTNLLRHRVRTLISIAGIAFSVAAMLTVVTILKGAVAMCRQPGMMPDKSAPPLPARTTTGE
jgi:hypothetical protein